MSNHFPFYQIGDFKITAINDGDMTSSLDLLSGIERNDAELIQHYSGIDESDDIHINCYLIQGNGRVILVDTGIGQGNSMAGKLKENLASVGISSNDIDTILLTHCHPDHIGGLLDAENRRVFNVADIVLHPLEAQHWLDDEKFTLADERGKRNFRLVRQTLEAYAGKVSFFNGENIAEAIIPVWLPGHTPGHTGFLIKSECTSLLIWGDIVHYPHIQLAQPTVSILFDNDPVQAKETRMKILEHAVNEKLIIAGMHLGQRGFSFIHKEENGYCIAYINSLINL